jgi:hypothetical protein
MPNSISLTGVYLPPGKPAAGRSGSTADGDAAEQSRRIEQELDHFRSELLRQKIVFEAELRRQREVFEDRIEHLHRENDARAEEVKQLRQMVQGLAIRVDNANAARPVAASAASANGSVLGTPRRHASPAPPPASSAATAAPSSRAATPRASAARPDSPYRRTPSRQPSPVRGTRSETSTPMAIRPHLTTVSRNSTLARLGSVAGEPWR